METKKSIVKAVTFKNESKNAYGPVFYFKIYFENNDFGNFGAKSKEQTAFVVGQEIEYSIDAVVNGTFTNFYVKPVPAKKFGGSSFKPFNQTAANAREALHSAAVLVAAGQYKPDKLDAIRDTFFTWLQAHSL